MSYICKSIIEDMEQVRITLPDTTTRTSLMVALRKLNLLNNAELEKRFWKINAVRPINKGI